MTQFSGRFDFRVTKDPVGDPGLAGFKSGVGEHHRVVNELIEHIWTSECPYATTVLIMEDVTRGSAQTIGVCAWRPRHPADEQYDARCGPMPQYIHTIGVSENYRGQLTANDSGGHVLLGHMLLGHACDQIAEAHPEAPFVWAYVAKSNRDSQYMFDRHRFKTRQPEWTRRFTHGPSWIFPKRPNGDVLRFRGLHAAADG